MSRNGINIECESEKDIMDILTFLFPGRERYIIPELSTERFPVIMTVQGLDWILRYPEEVATSELKAMSVVEFKKQIVMVTTARLYE